MKATEMKVGNKIKLEDGFNNNGMPVVREYTIKKAIAAGEYYLVASGVIGFTASEDWLVTNQK